MIAHALLLIVLAFQAAPTQTSTQTPTLTGDSDAGGPIDFLTARSGTIPLVAATMTGPRGQEGTGRSPS